VLLDRDPTPVSVSMMTRKTTLAHLRRATEPLLQPDERFLNGCAVWMADQRPKVPLLLTGRAIYLLAITSDRLLVFDTPRRGRPLLEADLLLQRRHDALELLRVRARLPMLQLRIAPAPERVVILEFRPRDRAVARALVRVLRDGDDTAGDETPSTHAESGAAQ
jgi:hypothetical protein